MSADTTRSSLRILQKRDARSALVRNFVNFNAPPLPSAKREPRRTRHRMTEEQLERLVSTFEQNTHPSRTEKQELADQLSLDFKTVNVWFQNRRQTGKKIMDLAGTSPETIASAQLLRLYQTPTVEADCTRKRKATDENVHAPIGATLLKNPLSCSSTRVISESGNLSSDTRNMSSGLGLANIPPQGCRIGYRSIEPRSPISNHSIGDTSSGTEDSTISAQECTHNRSAKRKRLAGPPDSGSMDNHIPGSNSQYLHNGSLLFKNTPLTPASPPSACPAVLTPDLLYAASMLLRLKHALH